MNRLLFSTLLAVLLMCRVSYAEPLSRGYERLIEQLTNAVKPYENLTRQEVSDDVLFRRDPMQSLVDTQGNLVSYAGLHDGLLLQGLIWSKDFAMVLVDEEFYAKGDQVGPYKILEIKYDGLVAERGSERLFIPLYRDAEIQKKDLTLKKA